MTNTHSEKTVLQDDKKSGDDAESIMAETSGNDAPGRTKKALSKREIMEQLSRERFPWDE